MRSFSFLCLTLSSLTFANETIEVLAKNVSATSERFFAYDDVVILYDGAMIKADSADYDKNASLLTLEGEVEMLGLEDNRVSTDKLLINTKTKSVNFQKLFLTSEENLWIDSEGATKEQDDYKLFNSRVSSCDVSNPDWTIEFKEAHYRDDKQFITMEDAKLRFYDTTVFYFPYLAFPTVHKRTTGLLLPRFKLSDSEGFLYEQPFFYAPTENFDLEFNPQIRTNRGYGTHVTARFVDSNHSDGYFRTGYFKNTQHYADKYDFNREHLGFELFYNSRDILPKFLRPEEYKSGLYFDGTYLNDREYLNLQKESASSLVRSNLIESRLNAFMYDEDDYFALYGKYNIDTSKVSNSRTLQEFPSLHYHHYMSKFPGNKLFYTIDARMRNHTRVEGSGAYQSELDIPITYYDSFFNDYLDLSVSENLYLNRVDFTNLDDGGEDYYFYRNYHTVELSSDLNKAYDGSVHTLHPSVTYIKPSFEKESPVKYSDLSSEQQELFVSQTQEEQLSFALSQYYFNSDFNMNFFHKFAYSIYPEREKSRGDFTNEMGYNRDNLALYSNLTYAWNEEKIRSLTSSLRYNQSNYDIMLTHFYNHDFLFDNKKTSFLNSELVHRYNDKDNWFFRMDYDIEQDFNHQWELGWQHKQQCWGASISIGQEIIPNTNDSFRNTALYFELNLNPIGGIKQNIEESFSSQGTE
ncbi:MAG: hypothetical protein K0U38_03590 [Epsilonproteobacteria bacterium]|nr:hypothetical protein [Campylobacterota bacterium]